MAPLALVIKALRLLELLILIRVLLSWVAPDQRAQPMKFVKMITDPVLKPFQVVIPMGGVGLDVGPILALLMLQLVENILVRIALF